jgi:transcriptional regulator with XRE-family HTH domain
MNYRDYFNSLEKTADYNETELRLKVILDLADEVLRLRMENGWSQSELAERVGTKQANISRLESGLSNPSINFLQKLANAFNTNISIKFERQSSVIDATTDVEIKTQAIPLPYQGFGIKVTMSSATSSVSIKEER